MAIYKNREVSVVGPNSQANTPESINVQYKDGSHENVKLSDVKFTKDEKDNLRKNNPSKYDTVATIEDNDLEAVRVGVAPASDPTYKEQADIKARHAKQVELNDKQTKLAEDNAKKDLDKDVSKPVVSSQPVTYTAPNQSKN